MTIQNRKSLFASIVLAMGLITPAIAADPLSDWVSTCGPYQQARQAQTGAQMGAVGQNDPYLQGVAQKNVAQANPYQAANGISVGNFNCNGALKGVFDSFLSSTGSAFGFDLGALFGGVAGAEAGNLCGEVNSAIGKTFGGLNLNCPRVNIPGFNNACHIGVSASTSGVSLNGSGALGGYSTSGNSMAGPNGVTGNGGLSGGGASTRGSIPQSGGGGSGILGSVANNVTCWISGTSC